MSLEAQNDSPSSTVSSYLLAWSRYLLVLAGGCTPLQEWIQNDFKVGPNFQEPSAAAAKDWIDASNSKILKESADSGAWWGVFKDAELDSLIESAYRENLDLKTAGTRVMQAQAQRNIAAGNLFPQSQDVLADYAHVQLGKNLNIFKSPVSSLPSNINVFATGFNASWELDFWGRFRRGVESADAEVGASIEDYRAALVTLLADVATNYVQVRTFQQRIVFARRNVEIQKGSLSLAEARLKDGRATELDV